MASEIAQHPAARTDPVGHEESVAELALRQLVKERQKQYDWDESKHPRAEAGSPEGGEFTSGGAMTGAGSEYGSPPKGIAHDSPKQVANLEAWAKSRIPRAQFNSMSDAANAWKTSTEETKAKRLQAAVASETGAKAMTGKLPTPSANDVRHARLFYSVTQESLRQAGVKYLDVYRGMSIEKKLSEGATISVRQNPLSSWTTSRELADGVAFAGAENDERSYVLKMRVPAKQVFATDATLAAFGAGSTSESEVVVMAPARLIPKAKVITAYPPKHEG